MGVDFEGDREKLAQDRREAHERVRAQPRIGDRTEIVAVCVSVGKGTVKTPVPEGELVVGHGLAGDAHAGTWHRQVSLLSTSSIDKMRALDLKVEEGSFAENLTVRDYDVYRLPVGTVLRVGRDAAELEVTQIGKECHHGCDIFQQVGVCVMPKEGIFARVLKGGKVRAGDAVEVIRLGSGTFEEERP